VAGQQWEVDAKKVAGGGLQTSQWGPYVGLFQIRALTTSGLLLARGVDAKRVRSKLDEALYNAKLAKQIVDSQGWRAWPSYVSGRFSNYTEKQDAIVKGWGGMTVDTAAATSPTGRRSAYDFAQIALQQAGDRYVFGAEASKGDPNPSVFDCSELVEWAAARVGCYMPDGSSAQMSYMRSKGTTISVATAVRTRGALLWIPGHIAISLGNGRTIEAANSTLGVVSMSATARSFSWQGAGKVPGMRYG
jgi:cell wall-associated NlpC family hydrolase